MWVKDSVRKFRLCVKAPLCKDSLCKSFCVFSLLGKCFFSRVGGCWIKGDKKYDLIQQHERGQGPPVWERELFGFRFLHWMDLVCAGVRHYYILLENLNFRNADDQLLVDALRDTARQRPHISSSFILNHHIFFTILFWSTPPGFSFGPKLSSMETKAAVNTHLLMWAKIKMDAYLYLPVKFSKVCSKI